MVKDIENNKQNLGRLQHQIMEVLWDEGEANAREITDAVNKKISRPAAHSTIQTLLRLMETKNVITHEKRERTFVYKPLVPRYEIVRSAASDLLSRVFHGSLADLVAHLIDNETIPRDEFDKIRQLIDKHSKQ